MTPFWSYTEIINGKQNLIPEILMNVVVFAPVGLFLGFTFSELKWKGILVVAVCISLLIEILQFILHRGFSELDDVMHNTIGCLLGYGAYKLARYGFKKIAYTKIIS
jgi:glycopeptide antibiotics resistance protein